MTSPERDLPIRFSNLTQVEDEFQKLRFIVEGASSPQYKLLSLAGFHDDLAAYLSPIQSITFLQEIVLPICDLITDRKMASLDDDTLGLLWRLILDLEHYDFNQLISERVQTAKTNLARKRLELGLFLGQWNTVFSYLDSRPSDWDDDRLASPSAARQIAANLPKTDRYFAPLMDIAARWESGSIPSLPGSVVVPLVDSGPFSDSSGEVLGILAELDVTLVHGAGNIFLNKALLRQNSEELKRVKSICKTLGLGKGISDLDLHIHLDIEELQYSGYSYELGLAMAISSENERFHNSAKIRCPSPSQVVTGALAPDGAVSPVSPDSLEAKVRAAFFSSMEALLVPGANAEQAVQIVKRLNIQYPNKPFVINTAEHIKVVKDSKFLYEPIHECVIAKIRRRFLSRSIKRIGSAILFGLFILFMVWLLYPYSIQVLDTRGTKIIALDELGLRRWSHEFHQYLDLENQQFTQRADHQHNQRLIIEDLSGDGRNDVVMGFTTDIPQRAGQILYLDGTGAYSWSDSIDPIVINGDTYSTFNIGGIRAHDLDNDGVKEIVAIANNTPWFPGIMVVWDIQGHRLSKFYNSGHILDFDILDMDHDGDWEILATLFNNSVYQGAIAVLDANEFLASAPQPESPHRYTFPTEKGLQYYIIFHGTMFMNIPGSEVLQALIGAETDNNGDILVRGQTGIADGIYYYFDERLALKRAVFSDTFHSQYKKIMGRPVTEDFPDGAYMDSVSQIRYWNGSSYQYDRTEIQY